VGSEAGKTQADWAPQSWFAAQASDEGSASYFGHQHNGYQLFRHARLAGMLDSVAGSLARDAMLDVGCATGALTERIRRRFGFTRAVGLDFVPAVLERGRQAYPAIEFGEAVLPDLPVGGAEFDLVVASEVLYYLTPEAQRQAIGTFARVLRPGGYLLVGSALGGAYFTPETIKALLADEFEIVGVDWLRMRLYHLLVGPFYYANRLDSLLSSGAQPGSELMQARFARLRPILGAFPFRQLIHLIALTGRPVLGSNSLPAVANLLARPFASSNIALLGRRR
jgi:SAM-dependent methyltransferase